MILRRMTTSPNDTHRPVRTVVLLGLSALVAAGGFAVAAGRESHSLRDEHHFPATETVALQVEGGDVNVIAGDVDRVSVVRDARWSGRYAPAAPELRGGEIRMGGCGPWWAHIVALPVGCDARYDVTVPKGTRVNLTSDNGAVDIAGRFSTLGVVSDTGGVDISRARASEASVVVDTGGVRLGPGIGLIGVSTDTGRIRGEGLEASRLVARTDTGGIDLTLAVAPDLAQLRTDTGTVNLKLPRGGYAIDATADTGSVDVDPVLQDGTSGHRVTVSTDTGGVTVGVAP